MWTPEPTAVAFIVGSGTAILSAAALTPLVTAGGRLGLMAHLAMAQHQDYESLASKLGAMMTAPNGTDGSDRRRPMENFVDAVVLASSLNQSRERVRVGLERGKYAMVLILVTAAATIACANLAPADTREAVAFLGAAWAVLTLWFTAEVRPVAQLIWDHGWPSREAQASTAQGARSLTESPQSNVIPQAEAAKQPVTSGSTSS